MNTIEQDVEWLKDILSRTDESGEKLSERLLEQLRLQLAQERNRPGATRPPWFGPFLKSLGLSLLLPVRYWRRWWRVPLGRWTNGKVGQSST